MAAKKTKTTSIADATLRTALAGMDASQYQEIREAYYKAIEGLAALSEALEIADAQQPISGGRLLDEHYIAVQALDAMKHSRLGAII